MLEKVVFGIQVFSDSNGLMPKMHQKTAVLKVFNYLLPAADIR